MLGMGGLSDYGNILGNNNFKHLNRDTSKIPSCRAQIASLSLDQMHHRSFLIKQNLKKNPTHPQLNKTVPCSVHHLFHFPSASAGCRKTPTEPALNTSDKFNHVQHCLSRSKSFKGKGVCPLELDSR